MSLYLIVIKNCFCFLTIIYYSNNQLINPPIMLNYWNTFLLIIIILLTVFLYDHYNNEKMSINGYVFNIRSNYNNSSEVAKMLSELNARILKFLSYLKNKYAINVFHEPQLDGYANWQTRSDIVERMLKNYNFEEIYETDPATTTDTSYTIQKGEKLYVCLRSKKNHHQIHDPDDIFFVLLHELSHMGNIGWGHGTDFWEVFKFVLWEAKNSNIYYPIDYSKNPREYCGLEINYSPFYNDGLRSIWL